MHLDSGFKKNERLSRKNKIKELFTRGSSFYLRPLRIKYAPGEGEVHQVVVTVPKRIFRNAVDRNRVKRFIREAYRRQKFLISSISPLSIAFIYSGDPEVDQEMADAAVRSALEKIVTVHGLNSES